MVDQPADNDAALVVVDGTDAIATAEQAPAPLDRRWTRRATDLLLRDIRNELDPRLLLRKAVRLVAPLLNADRVYVNLIEANELGEVVAEWHATGLEPFWDPGRLPPSLAELFADIGARGEALVLDDTTSQAGSYADLGEYLSRLGMGAALVAPLLTSTGFLGILTVGAVDHREWPEGAIRLTDVACEEIASALERARLFVAQQELVKQLQELDRKKSEFLATVSHELRTPLTSIAGYIEILIDGQAGPLNDDQRRMLAVLDRNTRRLRSLIEDLLTLSHIESGAFHSRAEEVQLVAAIQHACNVIEPSAQHADIVLSVVCSPDLGKVLGDPEQLERALLNLLSNAIKFTAGGGRIELFALRDGDEIVISIVDSGIGIPSEELPELFTRFFRASNAVSRAIPGTGLGLSIVASIVELHGGTIEVQSQLDAGTTFTIRLPAASSKVIKD